MKNKIYNRAYFDDETVQRAFAIELERQTKTDAEKENEKIMAELYEMRLQIEHLKRKIYENY